MVSLEGDDEMKMPEVVGEIASGIKAAEWAPDDEHLILINGKFLECCCVTSRLTVFFYGNFDCARRGRDSSDDPAV